MYQVNQACFLVDESGQLFQVGSPAIFHAQGESAYLEAEGTGDAWEVLVARLFDDNIGARFHH